MIDIEMTEIITVDTIVKMYNDQYCVEAQSMWLTVQKKKKPFFYLVHDNICCQETIVYSECTFEILFKVVRENEIVAKLKGLDLVEINIGKH